MYTCSPGIQTCPGVHQKKGDQQVKGGDFTPLLCPGECSCHGVLCPALESLKYERHRTAGAGPEEDPKKRARTPLLYRKGEKVGIVECGEYRVPVSLYCGL